MNKEGYIYEKATKLLKEAQEFTRSNEIGVREATWKPKLFYPDLPLAVSLMTDIHYGSIHTDYDRLVANLKRVEDTPNFGFITNGDDVDNFNVVGSWATGVYENPLPPQLQTLAYIDKIKQLDKKGKLGVMSFGNHNDMMFKAGYDWFESFARTLKASVFTAGGELTIKVGKQEYKIGMNHKHWGSSRLNPTNACKRMMEYEYPNSDIVFLGHTHVSEILHFERGGKDRIAVIGGTYKLEDTFAQKMGSGNRAGHPGMTVLLFPNEKRMVGFKDIEVAQQFMLALIFQKENEERGNP